MSLSSGVLPDDWKLAGITPIFNGKGAKTDNSNFRPISIIGCISMIAEREVQSQLMSYCIKHELITFDQFAFLKYHSTVGCLHRVIDDWYDAMNEGEYIMSCFLDAQKCFDCISHDLLLTKLSLYGINGTAHTCFHNYLTNRRQFVHVNGASSSPLTIDAGIPQGSALGPLLFIFINDLPQQIENASINVFADDSAVYTTGKSFTDAKTKPQQSINDAAMRFNNKRLSVNTNKTVCMTLGTLGNMNKLGDKEKSAGLAPDDTNLEQVVSGSPCWSTSKMGWPYSKSV